MTESFISIKKISNQSHLRLLAFPKATKKQVNSRLIELEKLGIKSISFQGTVKIENVEVLGKGYVGIVVLAKKNNKIVALKIRRNDSSRRSMKQEAEFLKIANKSGVGPGFIASSRNFLVMEYLNGEKIGDWIKTIKGQGSTRRIKEVIKKILIDCYNLDKMGLDHGELSNITKHVIIGEKITLIDFDSSSINRRVSNVTSTTQAIFIGSSISKYVTRIYKTFSIDEIISSLRDYKQEKTRERFEEVLKKLKI